MPKPTDHLKYAHPTSSATPAFVSPMINKRTAEGHTHT